MPILRIGQITWTYAYKPLDELLDKQRINLFRYIFCSPELKAQVSFSDHFLSVRLSVRLSVCPSVWLYVCKLFTFSSSSQEPQGQFKQTWHKASLGGGDSSLFKWGTHLFPRGDNSKNIKIISKTLRIFFFRTAGSISIILGTKHAWVVVIQVCLNEGPHPSLRGYNNEIEKYDLMFKTVKGR